MKENQTKMAYQIAPSPDSKGLSRELVGFVQDGSAYPIHVVEEKPLTIFLNSTEILTAMTIGDYPKYLALGFLFNQGMLHSMKQVQAVDYEEDLQTVVVRTSESTNYEEKLKKRIRTSGCGLGTVFGDQMELIDSVQLPFLEVKTSCLYELTKVISLTPSLYLSAGAIHGTVLCHKSKPIVYMEDVGRHNAVDKVNGWMRSMEISPDDKILYTTGRLTSEMVLKTAMMGIPVLVSRSGFTAWGVDLAKKVNLTLIGRLRGKRYICLSGNNRLTRDTFFETNSVGIKGIHEKNHPHQSRKSTKRFRGKLI